MSDPNPRIEQFRKMADADPNNELGHFSLGKAYLDAGQTAQAIQSFQRVIELNPDIAKVYQMLATALLEENRKPEAIGRLTQGVAVAAARGDLMPKNEMIEMLKGLGTPSPSRSPRPRGKPSARDRCSAIVAAKSGADSPSPRSATPREK